MNHSSRSRRQFIKRATISTVAACCGPYLSGPLQVLASDARISQMRFGLVTYLWGHDWDLPTLIENCERAQLLGVELRTTHKHGVEPRLGVNERNIVKRRFEDSSVQCVGLGSNERFDDPDPSKVKDAIERTKSFVVLSHDVGATGVKVKPDSFHDSVPREKTIEQIGRSLRQLGVFASGYGQEIRLEVHGSCSRLPDIKAIMDVADHPNVGVCWNSNHQDWHRTLVSSRL